MLKKVTVSVTLLFGTIVVLCADVICVGCPSGMVRIGNECYKWHPELKTKDDASDKCSEEGGRLAGYKGNFLETLDENPILEDYLPKGMCYWVALPPVYTRRPLYSLLGPRKWKAVDLTKASNVSRVCQYDVSIFEKDRRPPDVKMTVVRKKGNSAFIADQPLFVDHTPLPTMCSRLCQGFTGCSMFNYNIVTKECRGLGEMENPSSHYHQHWQFWVFD